MPTKPPHTSSSSRSQPRRDAIERLYVYWLGSTALLALVVIVLAVFSRGALHRQTAAVETLARRVVALEEKVEQLESASRPRIKPSAATSEPPRPAEAPPAQPPRDAVVKPPQPKTSRPEPPAPQSPPEATIQARLDQVVSPTPLTPADVLNAAAAVELLEDALQEIGRARWSGATWSRLAVLARLLGRDANAKAFARRAAAEGERLLTYTEVSARSLLARGRPREALPLINRLVEQTRGSPTSQVLLAAALAATGDPGAADETVALLQANSELYPRDRLLLARVLLDLEQWPRLEAALAALHDVPAAWEAEYNFLQAASLARAGRTVEALAILEYLAAHLPEKKVAAEAAPAWPPPGPDRYEIAVWRGVTLMHAQQPEAAREVLLQAAQLDPARPDAYYNLGILEGRAGQRERAKSYLQNALACSARLAPAWEALALLELNAREVDQALEHLATALELNPRRASAHFLLALAHAKLSRREPAAAALETAFRLDPLLLTQAKQTKVLLDLFTPGEMDLLAP
ncbi:MAG: tetratricopeptide repeat protein [Phycisphaerae bacterium]|nr:tetratricopeptide repeat protein [Phycisphaerae bacterium]